MAVHPPLSGRFGVVNGVTKVRDWSASIIDSEELFYDSSTRGGAVRTSGIIDSNGNFTVNSGTPVLYPGDFFTFEGYPLPATGVYGTDGEIWTIDQAILLSLATTWSWEKEQKLTTVYNFAQGTACPTFETDTLLDESYVSPTQMCSLGFKVSLNDSDYYSYLNILNATLTITNNAQEINNSYYGCCTGRTPGNLDWTLSITEENDNNIVGTTGAADVVVDIGNIVSFRLYVTSVTYWDLKWAKCKSWENLTVDRESGRIVQKTVNYSMTGIKASALGAILVPGGSQLWPPTVPT